MIMIKSKNLIYSFLSFMIVIIFCQISVFAENSAKREEAKNHIRQELIQRRKRIDIDLETEANEELAREIYEEAFEYTGNPKEGDYLAYSTYFPHQMPSITINGKSVIYNNIRYTTSADQEKKVDKKVAEILQTLNLSGKDDYEKVKAIHKWLVDHVEYQENSIQNSGSGYKALVEEKSSCRGYAQAFVRLCTEVGVESRLVFRGISEHEWNLVKLDGRWYHDDACGSDYKNNTYLCFLRGSNWWSGTGLPMHERFQKYQIENKDYVAVKTPVISSCKNQGSSIKIVWNNLKHAAGYRIYRKTNEGTYSLLKELTDHSYTDKSIKYGNYYSYIITAYDERGGVSSSSSVKALIYLLPPKGIVLKKGYKKLTLTMKKASGASGYQVQYSLKKSMKSSKTLTTKKLSCTISKLKKASTYYVRVRSYRTISGKKYYSAWSSIYSKKTK